MEHTSLRPDLTNADIDELVHDSIKYNFTGICIPPFWVKKASRELTNTNINLVTVAGFPFGYQTTEAKLKECEMAINNGANEVDIVMNISAFKSGMTWAKVELAKCAKVLHGSNVSMKVIIETALLTDQEIVEASKMSSDSGTDFVKTSTGYSQCGAKVEHIRLIKDAIPDNVGIKASGGIKTLDQTLAMISAGADRIGTSSAIGIIKEFNAVSQ